MSEDELLSRIRRNEIPSSLRARALRVQTAHNEVCEYIAAVRCNLYMETDGLVRPMRSPAEREAMVQQTQLRWNRFKQYLDELRLSWDGSRTESRSLLDASVGGGPQ